MYLIIMFDLPTTTKEQKKAYTEFRKDLLKEGFTMMQYSIYIRFCENNDILNSFLRKVENVVPKDGFVRGIGITQKQYENMTLFIGKKTSTEIYFTKDRLTIF